jgi:hypothetical protein
MNGARENEWEMGKKEDGSRLVSRRVRGET